MELPDSVHTTAVTTDLHMLPATVANAGMHMQANEEFINTGAASLQASAQIFAELRFK